MGRRKMAIDITPLSSTQVTLKLATKNQDALQEASKQIASGTKHDDFKGYAEDATTENFLNLTDTIKQIETHVSANNIAIARAKAEDSAISELQSLATDLAALITQRRNSASGTGVPVNIEAASILDKIATQLNVRFDGRYLFAGSKTNTKPIADIQTTNITEINGTSTATANYYSGDSDIASVRSSDSEIVEYGVLASDDAFKHLIGAAHLAISGHVNNNDTTLQSAMDMVNTAVEKLTTARATTKLAIKKIEKANTTHADFKLLIQENLNDVSQTDIVAATAKMSELQTIVQAGYLAYSRISNLKLVNFLQ